MEGDLEMGTIPIIRKKGTNPVDRHIGLRIRSRRLALGKTQEWLGDQLGLTFQQVQKYEKGANRVGGSRMMQIANALQTDPSFFFEDSPPNEAAGAPKSLNSKHTSKDSLDNFMANRTGVKLARAFVKIKNSSRQALLVRIAEEFAGE
jgi:transcriptional regulator with XRE-family HTH domain